MDTSDGNISDDGQSALSRFLSTICGQCEALDVALSDDAEALRILLAGAESRAQAEHEYAERKSWESETGLKAHPLFDDRDEKRAEWLSGTHDLSFAPAPSRVQELLDVWGQRNGYAALDRLFQAANQEAIRDGTAGALTPKLDAALLAHKELLNAARRLSDDEPQASNRHPEWDAARERFFQATCELPKFCRPVDRGGTDRAADQAEGEPLALTKEATAALLYIVSKSPTLLTLEKIQDGAILDDDYLCRAKATAQKAVNELIEQEFAARPKGIHKGVGATAAGVAVANKLRPNLVQS